MKEKNLREEALSIFIALLANFRGECSINELLDQAIETVKSFDRQVSPIEESPKGTRANFGEFTPSGRSLYFLSFDGSTFLISEYSDPQQAVRAAISFNRGIGSDPLKASRETRGELCS